MNEIKGGPVVKFSGVCKSFGSRGVLEDVSFGLQAGEGLCVCGPNAAGKTTLLKIASSLVPASGGRVEIAGVDVRRGCERIKKLIGVIFDKPMVYPQLTVTENLEFFARLYGVRDSKSRIAELLELTQLGAYRADKSSILSRGMTQRLAIARAMVHRPKILLADEPFTALDERASRKLIDILNEFRSQGGAVLMATHDVAAAIRCCGRVAVLDNTRLIFKAKVSEIEAEEFARDYLSYAGRRVS